MSEYGRIRIRELLLYSKAVTINRRVRKYDSELLNVQKLFVPVTKQLYGRICFLAIFDPYSKYVQRNLRKKKIEKRVKYKVHQLDAIYY